MKNLLFFLALIPLFVFPMTLKEKLLQGEIGDYIVVKHGKIMSILFIKELVKEKNILFLEEISTNKEPKVSWQSWINDMAPNNTSWLLLAIDLKDERLIGSYSFSKETYLDVNDESYFFPKLLKLKITPTAAEDRKKIGPPPLNGELDTRNFWIPKLFINEKDNKKVSDKKITDKLDATNVFEKRPIKKEKSNEIEAFRTTWPKDPSELSEKLLDLYFIKNFPFPCWIQVSNGHLSVVLQVVELGNDISSKKPLITFLSSDIKTKLTKNGIEISAQENTSFKTTDFKIFAMDITNPLHKKIHPFKPTIKKDREKITFLISKEDILLNFQINHKYIFMIIPYGYNELKLETKIPFIFTGF